MSRSIGQWYNFVIKQPGVRLFKARNKRLDDGRRRLILGTPETAPWKIRSNRPKAKKGRVLRVGAWFLLCRDQRQANSGKESNRSKRTNDGYRMEVDLRPSCWLKSREGVYQWSLVRSRTTKRESRLFADSLNGRLRPSW